MPRTNPVMVLPCFLSVFLAAFAFFQRDLHIMYIIVYEIDVYAMFLLIYLFTYLLTSSSNTF